MAQLAARGGSHWALRPGDMNSGFWCRAWRTLPRAGQPSGLAPGILAGASCGSSQNSSMRSTALKLFSAMLASRTCAPRVKHGIAGLL